MLRTHHLRRLTATEVVAALREPAPYTAPGVVDAVVAHVQLILPRLDLVARQRRTAARELTRLLDALAAQEPREAHQREHADVAIVRSMPGIGTRIAARMLAEASQPLAARAYYTLRGLLGVAPDRLDKMVGSPPPRAGSPLTGLVVACGVICSVCRFYTARSPKSAWVATHQRVRVAPVGSSMTRRRPFRSSTS